MPNPISHSDLAGMPPQRPGVFGARHWRFWVILSEVLVIAIGASLWYWPWLTISNIAYDGPPEWEGEICSLIRPPYDGNIFGFDPAACESRLDLHLAGRADAQVRLELPGSVMVRIVPYTPRLWTDDGVGVAADGSLLLDPLSRPERAIWRPGLDWEATRPLPERAIHAAGAWNELLQTDRRFEFVAAEWTQDPLDGWTVSAVDRESRICLGRSLIRERARLISRLLEQGDTLLQRPYRIDARFHGQLILCPVLKTPADSLTADSADAAIAGDSFRPDSSQLRSRAKGRA